MKILFFIDTLRIGGKERRLTELLKALDGHPDVEPELAVMSEEIFYREVFELNLKIHYLIRRTKKDPRIFLRFYRICRDVRPDIIHCWESMPALYAIPAAKLLRIPLINGMITTVLPRGLQPFTGYWLRSKLTFPFSDAIVANSAAGLQSFAAPVKKSHFIHNGFNFDRLQRVNSPAEIRRHLKITQPKVVGMVARFSHKKNYPGFVQAAQWILQKRNDTVFLAVGGGYDLSRIRRLVDHRFCGRILFTGQRADVDSLINIFTVGVLLTHPDVREGISNAILEYMAFGKPVVATGGGGTNELVTDRQTGFLVPPGDWRQLAEKILYLLDHPGEAAQMGAAGKERLIRHFSLEKMTEKYLQLYQNLAGGE